MGRMGIRGLRRWGGSTALAVGARLDSGDTQAGGVRVASHSVISRKNWGAAQWESCHSEFREGE